LIRHTSCRVCNGPLETGLKADSDVTCTICGTRNRITSSHGDLVAEGLFDEPEREIRERADEFARLRNYTFNDLKERIIQALLKRREKYGDFYCPCKASIVKENICPCKETRDGSVEIFGRCTCQLFWKPQALAKTDPHA
jgi:ferredoxin-thioredoxin reductase catalytic subunit